MSAELYPIVEELAFYLSMVILFIVMGLAIHDVLSKNEVPLYGRVVAYGVLLLGALGFLAKGVLQIVLNI